MAVDIYIDPASGDLDLSSNKTLRLTNSIEESSRQQVAITLATYRGEWFANINYGVPYLKNDNNNEQLMGANRKALLDIAIKNGILTRENIVRLISYESELNNQTRLLTVSFRAETNTGEVISIDNTTVDI